MAQQRQDRRGQVQAITAAATGLAYDFFPFSEATPNTKGLMFHSDQGVQYTAHLFQHTLKDHSMIQSMSHRGCCWDNAVQERFFRNLKTEYLNDLHFINHASIVSAVEKYLSFYNYQRLNSALNYLTPVQKRQELLNVA